MAIPYYVAPEQMVQEKAEYARKGIAKAKPAVALTCLDGALMVAENPSSSLNKISEIYDNIAFCGAGKFSEYENLRKAGIRHADLKGYAYGREDVTVRSLANAYSQVIGEIFSHEIKPLEVEILVVEVRDARPAEIFRISFDGYIGEEGSFSIIGGQADEIKNYLTQNFKEGLSLNDALKLALAAMETGTKQAVPVNHLEVALLDRNRRGRRFRRIRGEDLETLVKD